MDQKTLEEQLWNLDKCEPVLDDMDDGGETVFRKQGVLTILWNGGWVRRIRELMAGSIRLKLNQVAGER